MEKVLVSSFILYCIFLVGILLVKLIWYCCCIFIFFVWVWIIDIIWFKDRLFFSIILDFEKINIFCICCFRCCKCCFNLLVYFNWRVFFNCGDVRWLVYNIVVESGVWIWWVREVVMWFILDNFWLWFSLFCRIWVFVWFVIIIIWFGLLFRDWVMILIKCLFFKSNLWLLGGCCEKYWLIMLIYLVCRILLFRSVLVRLLVLIIIFCLLSRMNLIGIVLIMMLSWFVSNLWVLCCEICLWFVFVNVDCNFFICCFSLW